MARKKNFISDEEAQRMMEHLKLRYIESAVNKGIKSSLAIMRRGVGDKLEEDLGGKHGKGGDKRGFHPLRRDIKLGIYKKLYGGNVSLLPMRGKGRRSHVLIFLNQGTKERTKGHNRGRIKGLGFFERGVDATRDKAVQDLEQNIYKQIKKQYERYK